MWLSKLKENVPLTYIAEKDGFSRMTKTDLSQLAKALELSETDEPLIQSIPDIFFHASKFSISLYQEADFLRAFSDEAAKEWRALLAVCVTATYFLDGTEYELTMNPITGGDASNSPYTHATLAMKPNVGIWEKPAPYNSANRMGVTNPEDWTWDGLKVILLKKKDDPNDDGEPIAFTSPDTIIFPAANWNRKLNLRCPDVFPWVKSNEVLCPSDSSVTLTNPLAIYLVHWLNDFRNFLKGTRSATCPNGSFRFRIATENAHKFNKLCDSPDANNADIDKSLLSNFRELIINRNNLQASLTNPLKQWNFSKDAAGLDPYERSVSLATIIPPMPSLFDENGNIPSEVKIDIDPINGKPVIYVDDGEIYKNKIAAGMYTVNDVITKDKIRQKVGEHLHILKQNEVFLDGIIISRYSMTMAGTTESAVSYRKNYFACVDESCIYYDRNNTQINLLFIPIKQSALDLISLSNYTIEPNQPGNDEVTDVTVAFDLKLMDGSFLPLSKTYSQAQMKDLDMMASLPVASVWPRVNVDDINPAAGWNQYWVFCYDTPDSKDDDPSIADGFTATPYNIKPMEKSGNRFTVSRPITSEIGSDNCKYYKLNNFPQYMQITFGADEEIAGYLKLTPLPHTPPLNAIPNYPCVLDFGTSSSIMLGMNGAHRYSNPALNIGVGHILGIPLNTQDDSYERSLYVSKYFMRDISMPFATLLRDFNKNDKVVDRRFYEHSHIYFKELRRRNQRVWSTVNVAANMKWTDNRKLTEFFLCDVFRFALLDAVLHGLTNLDNFILVVSYPDSMADGARTSYLQGATNAFASSAQLFTNLSGSHKFYSVTESEAAAKYFVSHLQVAEGTNPQRLAVIDIGGGTSDIYYTEIYSETNNMPTVRALESSVKIGARNILVRALHMSTYNSNRRAPGQFQEFSLYKMLKESALLYDRDISDVKQPLGMQDFENLSAACQNENDSVDFAAIWESYLNRKYNSRSGETTLGDELLKHWMDGGREPLEQEKKILSFVALNIAAIVYYTAILLRESKNKTSELFVAFAGNGSKMIDWLGQDTNWKNFLTEIIHKGLSLGDAECPRVSFRRSPMGETKHETVKGMFDVINGSGQLNANQRKLVMTENSKDRLIALQTIIAGERYSGGGALTLDECEELLGNTLKQGQERFIYNLNKKNKPLVPSDETNSATSDLSERDFTSIVLSADDIGKEEFERFLIAYNEATERFTNHALIKVIKDSDYKANTGLCFVIDTAAWKMQRNIIINDYIEKMREPNSDQMEQKSFFLMGIEALNEELKYKL